MFVHLSCVSELASEDNNAHVQLVWYACQSTIDDHNVHVGPECTYTSALGASPGADSEDVHSWSVRCDCELAGDDNNVHMCSVCWNCELADGHEHAGLGCVVGKGSVSRLTYSSGCCSCELYPIRTKRW